MDRAEDRVGVGFGKVCIAAEVRSGAIAALSVAVLLAAVPAAAGDLHPAPADDLWTRDKLTGGWGGARKALSDRGIDINLTYIGEALGTLAGGFRQGVSFEHRIELDFDFDFEKLTGLKGATAHTSFYEIGHANGMPALNYVGSIADPSNIEALPSTRLFTAWYQQNFYDDKVSLRIGQIAADDEFLISPTATNLINSTFGYAAILAANQFQGGPVYPLATPGIRLQLKPTDEITFLSAVFAGAPAGENCTTLPQICNDHGLTFPLNGGALWMEEVQYGINQGKDAKGMPAVYKLGGWYASRSFPDQHLGVTTASLPVSLASPLSAFPLMHQGNWGIYMVADQMVWRAQKGPQALNVFTRAGVSPSDRNLVEAYMDGGVGLTAPLPGRDNDVLTFGFAYSQISADATALDRDAQFFTGGFFPVRDREVILELDYSLQAAPWWTFQFDLQEIVRPGGNIPNPLNPPRPIPNAFLAGVRTTIKF
jgi:porin